MFIDVNAVAVVALPLNAPVNVVALTVENVGVDVVNSAWFITEPYPVVALKVICAEPDTTPSALSFVCTLASV